MQVYRVGLAKDRFAVKWICIEPWRRPQTPGLSITPVYAHTHDGLCVQTPGIVSDTLEMPDPHHGSCPLVVVVVVVVVWLLHEVLPRL